MNKTTITVESTNKEVNRIYKTLFNPNSITSARLYRVTLNKYFIDTADNKARLKAIYDSNNVTGLPEVLEHCMIDGLYGLSIEEQFNFINAKMQNTNNFTRGNVIQYFEFYDYLRMLTDYYDTPILYRIMEYYNKAPKDTFLKIAVYASEDPLVQMNYSTLETLEQDEEFLKNWLILESNNVKSEWIADSLIDLFAKIPKKLLKEVKALPLSEILLMREKRIITRRELENFLKPESTEVSLEKLLQQFTKALSTTLTHDKKAPFYLTIEDKNVFYLNRHVLKQDSVSYAEIFEKLQDANVPLLDLAGFVHGLFYPRSISRTGDLSTNNRFINAMLQKHDVNSVIKLIASIVYDYDRVLPTAKEYFDFFNDESYDSEELLDYSWLFAMLGNDEHKKHRGISRELNELRSFKTNYMRVIDF